ncbi:acyl-CoA dehydrogenase family protein [Streptomyces aureoverticillatus]|uniref:acyl-CoA dehydrogenase family protein n=1 Tax=Streptomyces aureoverticillatus TaxID=66871 RepID=UPI0013DAFA86|nr:acyl-CoA dehydrogenase family protein [Streptomyces aureoverticillatus]QIB42534.1 acyl-CoA/acyl-ACP dehydrogenase [Streptomyces aureoverticillatus]
MRFLLDDEQRAFARSLDGMLTAADIPGAARDWAAGEHASGLAVWRRLGEAGVFGLAAPEGYEGVGPLPVETAVAFVELGRHAVPGPAVETVAAVALLSRLAELGVPEPAKRFLPALVGGRVSATLTLTGTGTNTGPLALDADTAGVLLAAGDGEVRLAPGQAGTRASLDPTRRLGRLLPGGELLASGEPADAAARWALDWAALATAAQCLGVGYALLDRTVAYVKGRTQFGVPVGSFQAVKHRLADVLVALEFARPLVFGAAVSLRDGNRAAARVDLAAAKVTAGDAAHHAARAALQLHGALGYTAEYDLSLWLLKARALRGAWGGAGMWRGRVVEGAGGS